MNNRSPDAARWLTASGAAFRSGLCLALVGLGSACSRSPNAQHRDGSTSGRPSKKQPDSVAVCDSLGGAICLRDTIREWEADSNDVRRSWIVFSSARDSIDFLGLPDGLAPDSAAAFPGSQLGKLDTTRNRAELLVDGSAEGFWAQVLPDRFLHAPDVTLRFPYAGAFRIRLNIFGSSAIPGLPYTLRVTPVSVSPALRLTGHRARLTLAAARADARIAVIPKSIADTLAPTNFRFWSVPAGDYAVLLVADSLYDVCKLPCAALGTIRLTPNSWVKQKF